MFSLAVVTNLPPTASPGAASEVGADGSMAGSRFGPWGQLARVKQLARDTTTSLFAGLDGAPSASVMMAGAPGGAPPLDPIAAAGPSPLAVALRRSFSGSCSGELRPPAPVPSPSPLHTCIHTLCQDGAASRPRAYVKDGGAILQ